MTFYQIKKIFKNYFIVRDGITDDEIDDLILRLSNKPTKTEELDLIHDRIHDLRCKGYTKQQTACTIQWEFAKSKNRAYELIKEGGSYDV